MKTWKHKHRFAHHARPLSADKHVSAWCKFSKYPFWDGLDFCLRQVFAEHFCLLKVSMPAEKTASQLHGYTVKSDVLCKSWLVREFSQYETTTTQFWSKQRLSNSYYITKHEKCFKNFINQFYTYFESHPALKRGGLIAFWSCPEAKNSVRPIASPHVSLAVTKK